MRSIVHWYGVLALSVGSASCQDRPDFKVTLETVDNLQKPLGGVSIETHIPHGWKPGEGFGKEIHNHVKVVTDLQGIVVLEGETTRARFTYLATKPGYYASFGPALDTATKSAGRWQPWNPTVRVELKRILNPIPLMAKKVVSGYDRGVALPAFGAPVGYDVQLGDWTRPHGDGTHKDIIFQIDGRTDALADPYSASLRISFSNSEDGILLHEVDTKQGGSQMRLPYKAPLSGYTPELVKRKTRTEGPATGVRRGVDQVTDDTKPTENYFLRVRTKVNDRGEVVSAHYGKVHGPFHWDAAGNIKFQYYFNPKLNDRNLEFDPTRNLLPTEAWEKVTEP